jgi:hypothetical protein
MTPRQCEIAAEAHVASLFARCGYDVLVQYGANQPQYDLVAEKDGVFLPISVKGSQDGGWILALKYKKRGNTYHDAIREWLKNQRKGEDLVYVLVQYQGVGLDEPPRTYIATPKEIAVVLKNQNNGTGRIALQEDYLRDHPRSKLDDRIPDSWRFSESRLKEIAKRRG